MQAHCRDIDGIAKLEDRAGTSTRSTKAVDRWIDTVWRHATPIAAGLGLATLGWLVYVATHLGFNLDNKKMIDPDLPFQRAAREFSKHFPDLDDALLIVVDAETPELSRDATTQLVDALAQHPDLYRDVYAPASLPFFARNALLYRSTEELGELGDRIAEMQPVLAELSRDPTIANLSQLVRLGLERREALGGGALQWADVLDRIGDATVEMYHEFPIAVSWEDMMIAGSGLDVVARQVIVVQPVLEFDRLLAAEGAISQIRETARSLGLTPERGVTVRITGNPALNYDEMYDLAWDVGIGGVVSFLLVVGVLFLALRSAALVAAAVATLLMGLLWTAAFATVAIGSLNLLSITFGLLFIGLGVDFPLHLGMHYAEAYRRGRDPERAAQQATREVASSLVLCALTTAIGFLAFVPTGYRGVSELGLISSAGMVIILVMTLTLFPALIRLFHPAPTTAPWARAALAPAGLAARHPKTVVAIGATAGLLAIAALPRTTFDSDVIGLRNPETESVKAFRDLLEDADRSPWSVDVLTPNLDAAQNLAAKLEKLPVVRRAVTVADYVPADQDEKRDILADAAFLLDTPPVASAPAAVPVGEQVDALRALYDALASENLEGDTHTKLRTSADRLRRELGRFLDRIATEPDPAPALRSLEKVLLGNFPAQMERLKAALNPEFVTLDSLPASIRSRMLAPDGSARVQVFPAERLEGSAALERFVDGVRAVAPHGTGVAANLVSFGRSTMESMSQALVWAGGVILLLLIVLQRRLVDAALILAPVTLGVVLTAGVMVALGVSFNFVNVVVLPLLLGVGVDSGIHLVRRTRAGESDESLPQTTAAAVFYSALTTIVGFGSLGLSDHLGVASMGMLLVIGMVLTLTANLIFLPALLRLFVRTER